MDKNIDVIEMTELEFGTSATKMFDIEDYSKIPAVLEAVLRASLKVEDNYEQLDNMTVEMVE